MLNEISRIQKIGSLLTASEEMITKVARAEMLGAFKGEAEACELESAAWNLRNALDRAYARHTLSLRLADEEGGGK